MRKKRIFSLMLALCLFGNSSLYINASSEDTPNENTTSENTTSETATLEEARIMAMSHMKGVIDTGESDVWNDEITIRSERALFNLDFKTSAYCFEFEDEGGNYCGYIVVNAYKNEYPIIEYSDSDSSFIQQATSKIQEEVENSTGASVSCDKVRIYYLGSLTYIAETTSDSGDEIAFDISDSSIEEVDLEDYEDYEECNEEYIEKVEEEAEEGPEDDFDTVEYEEEVEDDIDYSDYWDALTGSHLDSGSNTISNPSNYESGYSSSVSKNITGYNQSYKIMTYFQSGGVCAPTAATNMMIYFIKIIKVHILNYIRNAELGKKSLINSTIIWELTIKLVLIIGTLPKHIKNSSLIVVIHVQPQEQLEHLMGTQL